MGSKANNIQVVSVSLASSLSQAALALSISNIDPITTVLLFIVMAVVRGLEVFITEKIKASYLYQAKERAVITATSIAHLTTLVRPIFVTTWSQLELVSGLIGLAVVGIGALILEPRTVFVAGCLSLTGLAIGRIMGMKDDRRELTQEAEMAHAYIECREELATFDGGVEAGHKWFLESARNVANIATENAIGNGLHITMSHLLIVFGVVIVHPWLDGAMAVGLLLLGYRFNQYVLQVSTALRNIRRYSGFDNIAP